MISEKQRLAVSESNKRRATTRDVRDYPEYDIWLSMRQRCNNPKCKGYPNYGGRGIMVCERWDNFFTFLADMGRKPDGMSIERLDNDGNYDPSNCIWADRKTQRRNCRNTTLVAAGGKTQCLTDWCKELGLNYHSIARRIQIGWTPLQALGFEPKEKQTWKH